MDKDFERDNASAMAAGVGPLDPTVVEVDMSFEAVQDPAKKQFRIMFLVESPDATSSRDLSMIVEKALRDAGHEPVASRVVSL